jgi:hypothetical protein
LERNTEDLGAAESDTSTFIRGEEAVQRHRLALPLDPQCRIPYSSSAKKEFLPPQHHQRRSVHPAFQECFKTSPSHLAFLALGAFGRLPREDEDLAPRISPIPEVRKNGLGDGGRLENVILFS